MSIVPCLANSASIGEVFALVVLCIVLGFALLPSAWSWRCHFV